MPISVEYQLTEIEKAKHWEGEFKTQVQIYKFSSYLKSSKQPERLDFLRSTFSLTHMTGQALRLEQCPLPVVRRTPFTDFKNSWNIIWMEEILKYVKQNFISTISTISENVSFNSAGWLLFQSYYDRCSLRIIVSKITIFEGIKNKILNFYSKQVHLKI